MLFERRLVPKGGFDRLALVHPCTRSAGGRGSFRRHPWRLFLADRSALPWVQIHLGGIGKEKVGAEGGI